MIFYDRDTIYLSIYVHVHGFDNRRGRMFIFIINKSLAAFIYIFCVLFYFVWEICCCLWNANWMWWWWWRPSYTVRFSFFFLFFIDNILLNFYFMNHTWSTFKHSEQMRGTLASSVLFFYVLFCIHLWSPYGMFINVQCRDSSWVTLNRQTRKTQSINCFMTQFFFILLLLFIQTFSFR